MSLLSQVVEFKTADVESPKYRFLRIGLNNITGNSLTLSTAAQQMEFKLPICPYNLARSFLSYEISVAGTNNRYSYLFEDCLDLASSVTFGTAGGLNLVDLNYLTNYTKIARKIYTETEDYLGGDVTGGLYCNGMLNNGQQPNILPGGFTVQPNAGASTNPYLLPAGFQNVAPCGVFESQYSVVSPLGGAISRYRQYPLSGIVNTLFDQDRDFYAPVEMYLRLQTNSVNKMTFISTSNNAPTTANSAVTAAAVTANQLYLYLAVEQNQVIIDSVIQKYKSGNMKFQIPYTTAFRNSTAAATTASLQIPFSSQYGKRLHHVLHTVASTADNEQLQTAISVENWNGSKIVSFQTFLDNRPLQDNVLSCLQPGATDLVMNSDDWRNNEKYLHNNMMNLAQYQLNWFHIDNFYDPMGNEGLPLCNVENGLELRDASRLWQIQMTTSNATGLAFYTFATFLRDVQIASDIGIYLN